MRPVTKIIVIVLILLVGTVFLFYLFIQFRGVPFYEVQKIDYEVESTSSSIARGKKLASMLCVNCHMNTKTGKLTGTLMPDVPPEFGRIYSANITQEKEYGIGEWTDGELIFLLRTGIKRNGQYSPPYMAKLPSMSNEDIDAIIAFLKSDDEMVAPDPTPDFPCEPSVLTKFLCLVAFKPFPMPDEIIPPPDTTNTIEWGQYLAHNLDCYACHSADFKTNDYLNPVNSEGYFAGGNQPLNRNGEIMLTSNLTPDEATGIGSWTEAKFIKALRFGLKEGEAPLRYPMVPYVHLTDHEASAIYQYLKTIPPIENKVQRSMLPE